MILIVLRTLIIISLFLFIFYRKNIAIKILLFILLLSMFILPDISINSAKKGLELWLYIVTPSLLPFFIVNDIMISLDIPENISKLFSKIFIRLFKTSGYGAYVFIMSIFTGYPTGAKIVSQLIAEKKISSSEGQKILTFASTSGPLFIIGAVGVGILNNVNAGYIIFISHICGAILNGLILTRIFKSKKLSKDNYLISIKNKQKNILSTAIMNSLLTISLIGGYIIFFSVIIELLDTIKVFVAFENFLKIFLPINFVKMIILLLQSILEISNGCNIIGLSSLSFELKIILITFLISFSGISILMQVHSLTYEYNISIKKYIISKLLHSILSSVICILMLKINIFNLYTSTFNAKFNLQLNVLILLQILLITIFVLNLASIRKK